jgi:hypothetical protein
VAVLLIVFAMVEPPRGEAEGQDQVNDLLESNIIDQSVNQNLF